VALSTREVKLYRSLLTKKGRRAEGLFLAEGVRLLEEALAGGVTPRLVMFTPADLSERGQRLIDACGARHVRTSSISRRECQALSDTTTPQGIIALFESPPSNLEQQLSGDPRRILICDRVGDPGNLGTLIRAAAGFGFDLIVITAGSAEAVAPKTIRGSAGACFRVPIVTGVIDTELVAALSAHGFALYCGDTRGRDLEEIPSLGEKAALVIGSEATGSGTALYAAARFRVRIPMTPLVESFNAAMAGAVLMYWMHATGRRQR
jgi:TrmH family RNA methyltransferase